MRILLVQPPLDPKTSKIAAMGMAEPLGLEYLAGALPEHDVRILDLRVAGSLEQELLGFDPDLVGVTALTASLPAALGLLADAKRLKPEVATVIGGHHPTLRPDDCRTDQVDVIVRGDGEQALAELVRAIESGSKLGAVAGIEFQLAGEWTSTPSPPLAPLDRYPLPARHLTAGTRPAYQRVGMGPILSALTSRGCTRRCRFCSIWRFHGGKYRSRSAEAIVAELEGRSERFIDFVDDDSFGNLANMDRFRELSAARLTDRQFRFFVRSDTVARKPDHFRRWADRGLRFASIGLESFREQDLREYHKSATVAQNFQAIEVLKQCGIRIIAFVIIHPNYLADDFDRVLEMVQRLELFQVIYATLTPYPGTLLYEQVREQLVSTEWSHFDGFRAVLETALPRGEFYHRLAELYRRTYAGATTRADSGPQPWFEQLADAIENTESEGAV